MCHFIFQVKIIIINRRILPNTKQFNHKKPKIYKIIKIIKNIQNMLINNKIKYYYSRIMQQLLKICKKLQKKLHYLTTCKNIYIKKSKSIIYLHHQILVTMQHCTVNKFRIKAFRIVNKVAT